MHTVVVAHGAALSVDEYVLPATHATHERSVVGVPSTASPSPAGHLLHSAHDSLTAGANVPDAHGVHVALPDAAYWPATHGVHDAAPDDDAWPALHGVHVAVPSAAYEPASQGVLVPLPSQS